MRCDRKGESEKSHKETSQGGRGQDRRDCKRRCGREGALEKSQKEKTQRGHHNRRHCKTRCCD